MLNRLPLNKRVPKITTDMEADCQKVRCLQLEHKRRIVHLGRIVYHHRLSALWESILRSFKQVRVLRAVDRS